jgi:DNA-binding transcriptional ArsR family regulator
MVELIARRFRMLGEPMRLRILQVLERGEHTVQDVVEMVRGNQSNISRHLLALRDAGLVGRRQAGTQAFYSISDPVIVKVCRLVCHSAAELEGDDCTDVFVGQRKRRASVN